MKFIVIEGLDGAGKSTQLAFVKEYLTGKGIKSKFIHFPRTDSPIFGELIARFLRGELGDIDEVNPYLVALIYAGDRANAAAIVNEWLEEGYAVISDRYLYSNIAFQCAKVADKKLQASLAGWIKNLEYSYYKIPVPDLNLFLDVPFEFTKKSLRKGRKGTDRDYLKGAKDIHEEDLGFQQRVRDVYLCQVKENDDFIAIPCSNEEGGMLKAEVISKMIIEKIDGLF